jgi:flagellar biosynthesis chaperone FliJ
MREDCAQVDELLRQLADYKNDYADMAAVKLLKKCSTSWEAYRYLLDRVHDVWLPDYARQQVLGHSSLNVTAVYLQFNDQDIKELYDKTPF